MMTTITLKVSDEVVARLEALPEEEREAITAGAAAAIERALGQAHAVGDATNEEAAARQHRWEAGQRLLALADKGFNLGGIRIRREELYEDVDWARRCRYGRHQRPRLRLRRRRRGAPRHRPGARR
jgi:predicted transcriptional regulator